MFEQTDDLLQETRGQLSFADTSLLFLNGSKVT